MCHSICDAHEEQHSAKGDPLALDWAINHNNGILAQDIVREHQREHQRFVSTHRGNGLKASTRGFRASTFRAGTCLLLRSSVRSNSSLESRAFTSHFLLYITRFRVEGDLVTTGTVTLSVVLAPFQWQLNFGPGPPAGPRHGPGGNLSCQ